MNTYRPMCFVLMVIAALFIGGCGQSNKLTNPTVSNDYPTMEWYTSHIEEAGKVTLDQMSTIINNAYSAHPDSSIGPVRQSIWKELKAAKAEPQHSATPMNVDSYSLFSLNWQETLVLVSEPWNGPPTNTCKNLAAEEARRQWPGYAQFQDKADGFRHAYWNVLMCRRISEDWARKFSSAHEYGTPNGLLDAQMDLNNNGLGRAVWRLHTTSRSESQYSSIIKGWNYIKVSSFSNAVPYIIYLVGT